MQFLAKFILTSQLDSCHSFKEWLGAKQATAIVRIYC